MLPCGFADTIIKQVLLLDIIKDVMPEQERLVVGVWNDGQPIVQSDGQIQSTSPLRNSFGISTASVGACRRPWTW